MFGFDCLVGYLKLLWCYGVFDNIFGYIGFMGICVWVDLEEDLIFIFLLNWIYLDKYNNKL